eukprot:IDg8975t1
MQAMNQSFQQSVGALYDKAGGKSTLKRTVYCTERIRCHRWDKGKPKTYKGGKRRYNKEEIRTTLYEPTRAQKNQAMARHHRSPTKETLIATSYPPATATTVVSLIEANGAG